ncbi:hypothetical protein HGRIS_002429 [Hohenbuehelia grisea]|uniref:Proteophosphoglycan ppg4 n=1 Tax=Hohenbuehelia grisea TaxID=104357 RepID=A0ABR3JL46_9AGAR
MSIAIGGMGITTLRPPLPDLLVLLFARANLKSVFCFFIICIVVFVLAYLTNPSENSFRAYLTEQSFRHHLSRLDDNIDDDSADLADLSSERRPTVHPGCNDAASFHFANRTSISLRTPRHVFHSFAVFTIAAVVPLSRASHHNSAYEDPALVSDSWYIGAFGRWWRGGVIEAWYQDLIARSADEESWRSGILGIKSLRKAEFMGLPYPNRSMHAPAHPFPQKPQLRESRIVHRQRSASPPPLPPSVSLPLHANHLDNFPANATNSTVHSTSQSLSHAPEHSHSPSLIASSTLFDQSPRIVQVLAQIAAAQSSVHELRTQLSEHQSSSSQIRTALQEEVDVLRARKRKEDASKFDLKTRSKTLEDSKRAAEGTKRDAEKRLKTAQIARDDASQRMAHLEGEIATLQRRFLGDDSARSESLESVSDSERAILDVVESKRREAKIAESVVVSLNQRAKELEEKLAREKERLKQLREHQSAESYPSDESMKAWPGESAHSDDNGSPSSDIVPLHPVSRHSSSPSRSSQTSLGTSSLRIHPSGYSHVNGDLVSSVPLDGQLAFPVFDDAELCLGPNSSGRRSPTTPSFLPSGLMTSLDSAQTVSRSFQSDKDIIMDKDWRINAPASHYVGLENAASSTSPTSLHGPSFASEAQPDPFEVRVSQHDFEVAITDPHYSSPNLHRTLSDPRPHHARNADVAFTTRHDFSKDWHSPRRWFSTLTKAKKSLNPDAEVFSFVRSSPSFESDALDDRSTPSTYDRGVTPAFDALNPNGFSKTMLTSSTSTSSSLLRAFAPSPEEREALKRALGGSTNASLEHLPSLSDVGSIPSSPTLPPASIAPHNPLRTQHVHEMSKLPSWIQALPRIKKPNFSPWDDDEASFPDGIEGRAKPGVL